MMQNIPTLNAPARTRLRAVGASLLALAAAPIVDAQFEAVDDFENGIDAFTVIVEDQGTGSAEIVADPIIDGENNVLAVTAGDAVNRHVDLYRPIPTIPEGNVGTVFLRIAIDSSEGGVNGTWAVSPLEEATAGWGSANVLFNPSSNGGFTARNGNAYQDVTESRSNLTWYKVWYVITTADDTYDVYIMGGEFGSPTQIVDDFAFRKNAEGEDMMSFYMRMWAGSDAENINTGFMYVDDIFVDPSAANMDDPAPDAAPNPMFEAVEDFESGLDAFTVIVETDGAGTAEIVADPITGTSNNVLEVSAHDSLNKHIDLYRPIPTIPEGTTGTVFMRIAVDSSEGGVNGTWAVSPLEEATAGWGSANVLFNPNGDGGFNARDGGSYVAVADSRRNLSWYKVWYIIDTTNDIYDVYIQGGIYSTPTMIVDDFGFRKNAEGEDMMSFYMRMWAGSDAENLNTGFMYVDDIFVDPAYVNLADPVPGAAPSGMFHLVDDFQGGIDDWTVSPDDGGTGTVEIVPDPIGSGDVSNNVLEVWAGDFGGRHMNTWRSIPTISDGGFGTVFFRLGVDSSEGAVNGTYAISPVAEPTGGWGDNNVLFNPDTDPGGFDARDGTAYVQVAESRENLTWYKVWYIINTADDTYSVYIQGGEYDDATLLAENFAFRKNTEGEDLITFYMRMFAGDNGELTGLFYLDDLYVDPFTANMSDPLADMVATNPMFGIYRAGSDIVVDGELDGAYTNRGANISLYGGTINGPDDMSATVYGAWSDMGVHLFFDVTDDVFSSDHPDARFRDDSVEVAFDPENNDNGGYDGVNDVKMVFAPQADGTVEIVTGFPAVPGGAVLDNVTATSVMTETGWAVEALVPWEALQIMPVNGNWTMGLGLQINDDDGVDTSDPADGFGDRDGFLRWSGPGANINNNTAAFGDVWIWDSLTAVVRMTSTEITIDGVRDDAFVGPVNVLDNRWTGSGSHPTDNTATWRMVYDEDNLYLFLEVVDDSIIAGESEQPWHDDGLEFAIDGDNNKGGGFDGNNDVKISFRLTDLEGGLEIISDSNFPTPPAGTDFSGLEAAQMVTDVGYNLEVKMPLSIFKINPMPLGAFGVEFNLSDDDDGGNRDGILSWSSGGGVNNNTDDYGTAYFYGNLSTEIAMTESEMTIDGDMDADYEMSGWNLIGRTGGDLPLGNDASGYWTAVYDADNLYLLVDIMDDDLSADSPDQAWHDDGLEIFFDPGNDDNGSFDGVDDVKISAVIQPGETAPKLVTDSNFPTPPAGTDFSGLEAAWTETSLGWRIELKVPMVTLRMNGLPGTILGFEVSLQDDDEGGNRDHILTWSTIGNTNFGTHLYGSVIFAGDAMFSTIIGADNVEGITYDSDWLGMFEEDPEKAGWIEHAGLGWLYTGYAMAGDTAFWVYSLTFNDWLYLTDAYFPWIYFIAEGWGYYVLVDADTAWIYDYDSSSWVEIE